MGKKRVLDFVLIALGIFSCIFLLIFLSNPSITGMVVYGFSEEIKVWNADEFITDINTEIISSQARLKQSIITIEYNSTSIAENLITSATYEGNDQTDKVSLLDNQHLEINKNKIFNIFFNNNLNNQDIIQIYLKQGAETDIFLCNADEDCEYPGYGHTNYPGNGNEGFYNITISNLNSPLNSFRIKADKTFGINYITSSKTEIQQYFENQTVYPSSGEIQTEDLFDIDLAEFNKFFSQDLSHGQPIVYYYSTDSGNIWSQITTDNLSSVIPENKKIRIKAVLSSNQTETPVISSVSVSYLSNSIICSEDWAETYSECNIADQKLKYYVDANSCGTSDGLPADNNTFVECDYCTPILINTSFSEWQNISECYPNSTIKQERNATEYDINNCYPITNLSEDNFTNTTHIEYRFESCTYSAPEIQSITEQSQQSSSGGGGSSRARTIETIKTAPSKQEPASSSAVVPVYNLQLSIPDSASILDSEPINGKVTNLGNTVLENINIALSPELADLFQSSSINFERIDAGQALSFVLTKKQVQSNADGITGAAISDLDQKEIIAGNVILEAFDDDKQVIAQSVPFNIEVLTASSANPENINKLTPIFSIVVLLLIIAFYLSKSIKPRKKNKKHK